MPAHDLAWPGDVRVPDLQMYGTKRKAPPADGQHMLQQQQPMQDEHMAKRACLWGAGDSHQEQPVSMEDDAMPTMHGATPLMHEAAPSMMENNNNNLASLQPDQQLLWQQKQQQQQQHISQNGMTHNSLTQQPGGIMDLCGETFAPPSQQLNLDSAAESDALMAMDSDCTPDPAQYKADSAPTSSDTPSEDTQTKYCSEYCGLGEMNPSSSKVKCFCKPSWEGMLSMRPYISDIY